jgi:poly-gamma-glutamate synthesis protein (capsule biosynthesis protein)
MIAEIITLFLCGDVMTGRGIDQILPYPSDPVIYEPYMKSALGYVELAERVNGPIARPVRFSYIWGDALDELERRSPDFRIINLETAITKTPDHWVKGINYRMSPKNVPCLKAAKIDYCSLANNHTLDWGYPGLAETLDTLRKAGIKTAGAGRNLEEAEAPALLETKEKGRVLVFAFGLETSGTPSSWAASNDRPGINMLKNLSVETVRHLKERIDAVKRPGDIVMVSIHWGENWGYEIPQEQVEFAHRLVDEARVDLIHGHSSHHPKGIEVYQGKLILYGCGDLINDYEGIEGREEFRADLGLLYLASLEASTGKLVGLRMVPTQMKRFRLNRAAKKDVTWLRDVLDKEGQKLGTGVKLTDEKTLELSWK